MTAFLKIDECRICRRGLPWEFVPAVRVNAKTLAGTGVWRSLLEDGVCPSCRAEREAKRQEEHRAIAMRDHLIQFLGGLKPYREFTFDKFTITSGNRLGHEAAREFNPGTDSLYLWGSCGLGKTHLAYAIARRCLEETLAVTVVPSSQLSRRVRMKDPAQEQDAIDQLARVDVLVLDDLGAGSDSAFSRQILQEILDARDFGDRSGLVATSRYSLDDLAAKLGDDSIPSRLAGMCRVVRLSGSDHRLAKNDSHGPTPQ